MDHGSEARTEGTYRRAWASPPVLGLTVEKAPDGNDFIYVSTHGQGQQQHGFIYKTTRDRLMATGEAHKPLWIYEAGKEVGPVESPSDSPGVYGSALLAEIEGEKYIYAIVGNWPDSTNSWLDPNRGWIVRVRANGPDGSEKQLPLKLGDKWYPAINCTMDANGNIWINGGMSRPVENSGRILRTDPELSELVAISAGTLRRSGICEIVLGSNYLYAMSNPAWEGDEEEMPVIYKLGDKE